MAALLLLMILSATKAWYCSIPSCLADITDCTALSCIMILVSSITSSLLYSRNGSPNSSNVTTRDLTSLAKSSEHVVLVHGAYY